MSKTTPGPWRFGPHVRETASMVYAGDYSSEGEPDMLVEVESEYHRADARLIAAAPDLLAALTDLLNAYFPESTRGARSYWKAAEAAIAKAEGEPSEGAKE